MRHNDFAVYVPRWIKRAREYLPTTFHPPHVGAGRCLIPFARIGVIRREGRADVYAPTLESLSGKDLYVEGTKEEVQQWLGPLAGGLIDEAPWLRASGPGWSFRVSPRSRTAPLPGISRTRSEGVVASQEQERTARVLGAFEAALRQKKRTVLVKLMSNKDLLRGASVDRKELAKYLAPSRLCMSNFDRWDLGHGRYRVLSVSSGRVAMGEGFREAVATLCSDDAEIRGLVEEVGTGSL